MYHKVYYNKISKNGDSLRLGIPAEIVKMLNLEKDDTVVIKVYNNGFSVDKVMVEGVKA